MLLLLRLACCRRRLPLRCRAAWGPQLPQHMRLCVRVLRCTAATHWCGHAGTGPAGTVAMRQRRPVTLPASATAAAAPATTSTCAVTTVAFAPPAPSQVSFALQPGHVLVDSKEQHTVG